VNRSIANLLESRGALSGDPADAVDLYTRQSCLAVSARDLATVGATLALGGVNPVPGERVVDENTCRHVLAVMTTAGLYQELGERLYDVGLPAKSGIGGGIITVAPGKGGPATFAPPARRGREQRARTACGSVPVARARAGHLHVTGPRIEAPLSGARGAADPDRLRRLSASHAVVRHAGERRATRAACLSPAEAGRPSTARQVFEETPRQRQAALRTSLALS
jgi:hypothetical protein